MRSIHIDPINKMPKCVVIGNSCEREAVTLIIDVSAYVSALPGCKFELIIKSPAGMVYSRDIVCEGNKAKYTIQESDTMTHGSGEMQLLVLGKSGEKVLTYIWETIIARSLVEEGFAKPPEPFYSIIEQMEKIRDECENLAEFAKAAEANRNTAEVARMTAEADRDTAEIARMTAERLRATAEEERAIEHETAMQAAQDAVGSLSDMLEDCKADIINRLCPEMTAEGCSVQCHALAGTNVHAKVTWSPTQEGDGTPSPDNIRKIVTPAKINFMVTGANLINSAIERDTANGLLYVGVTEGNLAAAMLVPGQPYTIDRGGPCEIDMKINVIYTLDPQIKSVFDIRVGEEHITFVLPPEMPSGAYAIAFAAATGTEEPTIGTMVTLWRGREALPYKEYCGGKAVISTDDACGGTYDAVSGDVASNWAYTAFNGAERWREVYDGRHIYFCPTPLRPASEEWYIVIGMCSHYQYYYSYYDSSDGTGIWTETIDGETGYAVGADVIEQCPSINAFKRYLMAQFRAGTPVQVAYKLAEPYKLAESYPMPMHARAEEMSVATDGDSMHVAWHASLMQALSGIADLGARVAELESTATM